MNQAQFIEEEEERKESWPPIPPNCKYFVNLTNDPSDTAWAFCVEANADDYDDPVHKNDDFFSEVFEMLNEPSKTMRPIIAAVAESAWLKESRRLNDLRKEHKNKPVSERPNYTSPMIDANINAEKWRIWGDKK